VRLYCPPLASGSVKGTLEVQDYYNWLHSVSVPLTVTSKDFGNSCKVATIEVNAVTKETASQQVLFGGKQPVALQYNTLVNDGLFHIYSDSQGIHVTPMASASSYKSSYKYTVNLYTETGARLENILLTVRVNKSAPKVTVPSKLYLNTTQRGYTVIAAMSGKLDWNLVDPERTSVVVKKGKSETQDLSAVYTGNGTVVVTTQQKCSGKYTVEVTPVLYNGETLKKLSLQITGTGNATATAKTKNALDMREHLTAETAVSLTLKNTSARVENITIVNGFSSIFEMRGVALSGKDPVAYIGLKDGMDIPGGTHKLELLLTLSDGTTLTVPATIKVTCSKLGVSLPVLVMAQSAKDYTVSRWYTPSGLKDNAVITGIANADDKSAFQVSYSDGYLVVTANSRFGIRRGIYTVNCVVYASNDLCDVPGTPCKLRVIVY